jgi:membrane protein implicated in regulation of membrane protease activity
MKRFIKGYSFMIRTITFILLALVLLTPVSTAVAYVGPGAGMSVLGSLLSILATIFVAIGAILIWPLRKFMKRRKARRNSPADAETVNAGTDTRDDS